MNGFFWSTYVVLWVIVGVLTLMVVLLYRQFGLMWMRSSRRIAFGGLDIGGRAPELSLEDASGKGFTLAWQNGEESRVSRWMVLFALPDCPICKGLLETVGRLPDSWPNVEFVWIDTNIPSANRNGSSDRIPHGWRMALSASEVAHKAMEVPAVPYGYVLRRGGVVASKGLVNSVEDIASLLGMNSRELSPTSEELRSRSQPKEMSS